MTTTQRVCTRYVPTLRAYALISLIADTTSCAELSYVEEQCKMRKKRIFLDRCRDFIPDLVSVECEGQWDATYTFADTRFSFGLHRDHAGPFYKIHAYAANGPPVPMAWSKEPIQMWLVTDALRCPITIETHRRIMIIHRMKDELE